MDYLNYTFAIIYTVSLENRVSSSVSPPFSCELWEGRNLVLLTFVFHTSKEHLAHSRPSANVCMVMVCIVMGMLRRGCGCDPGSWHPVNTGGICAGHGGAKSAGSLFQDRQKVLCQRNWTHTCHRLLLADCVCVRAECEAGCRSQAIQEGGQSENP